MNGVDDVRDRDGGKVSVFLKPVLNHKRSITLSFSIFYEMVLPNLKC